MLHTRRADSIAQLQTRIQLHSIHFMPFDTRILVGRFSSAKAHIFFIVNLFYLFCSIRFMMTVADWLGSANKVAVKTFTLSLVIFVWFVHLLSFLTHRLLLVAIEEVYLLYRTQEIRNRKVSLCFALAQQ